MTDSIKKDNIQANQYQDEVQRFNALAASWWDKEGPMWPLHAVNPLRINLVQDHIDLHDRRVLDIGCGGGIACEAMARRGAKVTGIDLAPDSIRVAAAHAEQAQLDIAYRCMDAEQMVQQSPPGFDLVCCFEVLEHVPDPARLVANCARLVISGGLVVFSTINRNPKAFASAIVGAEYLLGLLPKGTHSYEKLIRPSELIGWAETSRLQPQATKGMGYNPLTRNFYLRQSLSVNYFLITSSP